LKAADIGIAMGRKGTDVAREAAALLLLDDDFTSIVHSVRIGRRIYDNIRKAMSYVLAIHVPIAGVSLIPAVGPEPPESATLRQSARGSPARSSSLSGYCRKCGDRCARSGQCW